MRRAAGGELQGWINQSHHLGCFLGDATIFIRRLSAYLPRTVHFIAQTPELHSVWLFVAMFRAQIAIERSARVVAVLQEMAGFIRSSGSQVDAQHRLCAGRPAPFDKLVCTESIGFRAQP